MIRTCTMNLSAEILYEDSLDQVKDILKENEKTIKKQVNLDIYQHHLPQLSYYLNKDTAPFLIGCKDKNNTLLSILGLYPWKEIPFGTILFLVTKPGISNSFHPLKTGVLACLDKCYEIGESLGIFEYYSLRLRRNSNRSLALWEKYATPRVRKYVVFEEYCIKAGKKPNCPAYWAIAEKRVWPLDVSIRRTTLKLEYRQRVFICNDMR